MTLPIQYKDINTDSIYSIQYPLEEDIPRHCTDYLNYIEESTNTLFHELEYEEILIQLKEAFNNGQCAVVLKDNVEECFIYSFKESKKVLNIKAVHSYYNETIPKAKILLIDFIYSHGLNLRITPMDKWFLPITSIVNTNSLKLFRQDLTVSIKCKRTFWETNIIDYINLVRI